MTAQNVIDLNGYTVGSPTALTLINVENVIDKSSAYINNAAKTVIAVMAGLPAGKILTATRSEVDAVLIYASLGLKVLLRTGSTNYAIGGLSATTVTNDSSYAVLFEQSNVLLRPASQVSMTKQRASRDAGSKST